MSLEAKVRLTLGALSLEVELSVGMGEVVAILGPNGSGKTTLLRALAGLVPLGDGLVILDGEVLEDPASGLRVATAQRPIGFVFQDYLLFPHLSALENVAFGLRARGLRRAEADRRARGWLERVGLARYASARPTSLSGGQAQRVALARALATDPRLLLLDEPLAALDAGTRVALRRDLRRHLRSFEGTRLLVTHDPLEAAALADRLVVIEEGNVVQEGTPAEVSERPRSAYVAQLVGLNLFRGKGRGDRIELASGTHLVVAGEAEGEVFAVVHPRS
ncbi:MAG: ABC transporter ATP-binding protein, partial [Actinomycetota bacterium]